MNNQIRTYDDLVKEKQRLEISLREKKAIILSDIQKIQQKLEPIKNTFEVVKKFITRDRTNLLFNLGSDIAINAVVRNFILSKAGWLTKIVVPFFLKNYTSNVVAENKDGWIGKFKNWFSHLNHKEHTEDDNYAKKK